MSFYSPKLLNVFLLIDKNSRNEFKISRRRRLCFALLLAVARPVPSRP